MEPTIVSLEICVRADDDDDAFRRIKELLHQAGLRDFLDTAFDECDDMQPGTYLIDDIV